MVYVSIRFSLLYICLVHDQGWCSLASVRHLLGVDDNRGRVDLRADHIVGAVSSRMAVSRHAALAIESETVEEKHLAYDSISRTGKQ